MGMFKKKSFNKKNFFSKQDDFDEDEFVITKKKWTKNITFHKRNDDELDQENDYARSKEVIFMAFTNHDDSEQEGEGIVDELLMSAIEENEKLWKKFISLKVEKEEAKRSGDFLNNKLKEKEEICEKRETKIVLLKKEFD